MKEYVHSRRYGLFIREWDDPMIFDRVDEMMDGLIIVRYILVGYTFEINATANGIVISGITPRYTDATAINETLVWAYYQSQRLRETGHSIPQDVLNRGEIT